ncbi:hypothetical protein OG474_38220 [Kribbella sp. NBC_01505]|uniref:hypothetical protein n=1 Tax=Kribbella sp. NBC_01505 TaxID=2903580 RepID=UPI0038632BDB
MSTFTAVPGSARKLWDMVDGPMPRGLLGVGDPDVHHVNGRWIMYLGGFSSTLRNRLYRATLPAGAEPERMYYTGRATARQFGPRSRYSIGVLERQGDAWVRRDAPIITGDEHRPSVLEPVVVYANGRYRMWYQANPHEIGPGDLPDNELRYAESANGVDWSKPTTFAGPNEGFFDNAVIRRGDEWLMVLARGGNLHGTPPAPKPPATARPRPLLPVDRERSAVTSQDMRDGSASGPR